MRTSRRSDDAIAAYRRSAELTEPIVVAQPDNLDAAANAGGRLVEPRQGPGQHHGKTKEADTLLDRSRRYLEAFVARVPHAAKPRDLLADILHQLGDHASDRGEFEPARDLYLKCLKIREGLVLENPDDPWQLSQLARMRTSWGSSTSTTIARTRPCLITKRSRVIRERLLAAEPASAELKVASRGRSRTWGTSTTPSAGRTTPLPAALERCVELRSRVIADDPGNAEVRGASWGARSTTWRCRKRSSAGMPRPSGSTARP